METKLLSNKILEKQIEIEDRFLTSSHLQSCQLLVRGEGSLRHILQLVSWEISDIMKNCSHQIFTISNVIVFQMNYNDNTNISKTYIRFNWEAVWKAWAPISVILLFSSLLWGKCQGRYRVLHKNWDWCSSFKGFLIKVIKVFSSVLDMTWIHRYAFSTFLFKAGLIMRLEH